MKTERLSYFLDYIETCAKQNQYVGQGNPLANILIIGMEPAINTTSPAEVIRNNIKSEKDALCNGCDNLDKLIKDKKSFKGNHTWKVYQKLVDMVFDYSENKPFIDFEKYTYTTEMNNWASKHQMIHSKNKKFFNYPLLERRRLFKESSFIQDFPVVILACGNYIINKGVDRIDRQIDYTFHVKFDVDGEHTILSPKGKQYKYWTHHSSDEKRLVIHTRQLSGCIPNSYLSDIANTIKTHIGFNRIFSQHQH
jgi:hypothetical protein